MFRATNAILRVGGLMMDDYVLNKSLCIVGYCAYAVDRTCEKVATWTGYVFRGHSIE